METEDRTGVEALVRDLVSLDVASAFLEFAGAQSPHFFDRKLVESIIISRVVDEYIAGWGDTEALETWLADLPDGALNDTALQVCSHLARLGNTVNSPLVYQHAYYSPVNLAP